LRAIVSAYIAASLFDKLGVELSEHKYIYLNVLVINIILSTFFFLWPDTGNAFKEYAYNITNGDEFWLAKKLDYRGFGLTRHHLFEFSLYIALLAFHFIRAFKFGIFFIPAILFITAVNARTGILVFSMLFIFYNLKGLKGLILSILSFLLVILLILFLKDILIFYGFEYQAQLLSHLSQLSSPSNNSTFNDLLSQWSFINDLSFPTVLLGSFYEFKEATIDSAFGQILTFGGIVLLLPYIILLILLSKGIAMYLFKFELANQNEPRSFGFIFSLIIFVLIFVSFKGNFLNANEFLFFLFFLYFSSGTLRYEK